jgi:hypothetical protein
MSTKKEKDKTPETQPKTPPKTEALTTTPAADLGPQEGQEDGYTTALTTAKNALVLALDKISAELTDDKEKEDIAKIQESATPSTRGVEEIDETWSIPNIRVVQGMTREKPDNARVGDLFTTAGEVMQAPVRFTPLYMYEQNRMFPAEGKGPVCFAPDAKLGTLFGLCKQCVNLPLGKNASGQSTDCDNGICALVLTSDMQIYRIEFYRTSKKAGRQLFTYAKQSRDIWHKWYSLNTSQVSNERGEYYIMKTSASGEVTEHHVRAASEALFGMIQSERKAFLKQHWDNVMSGGKQASAVDENVDFSGLSGEGGDGDTNPDVSDAGL